MHKRVGNRWRVRNGCEKCRHTRIGKFTQTATPILNGSKICLCCKKLTYFGANLMKHMLRFWRVTTTAATLTLVKVRDTQPEVQRTHKPTQTHRSRRPLSVHESNWHKKNVNEAIYIKQRAPTMYRDQGYHLPAIYN